MSVGVCGSWSPNSLNDVVPFFDADRMATQFKNWQVHHNYIETCGNKAVELAECNGGLIADNYIDGTLAGSMDRALKVADSLIAQTRTAR